MALGVHPLRVLRSLLVNVGLRRIPGRVLSLSQLRLGCGGRPMTNLVRNLLWGILIGLAVGGFVLWLFGQIIWDRIFG